jgi:two-component system alkaline phosphatase synthesis response regulator PhoP
VSARILVVDDDEHILRAMATSLTRAGFQVLTADDGEPALAVTAPVDVIVVDYNMKSDVTGADVVRHFKTKYGGAVTCFVLSGEDNPDTREICLAAGATDVLLKPVSPVELRRLLKEAAANRTEAA